MYNRNLRKVKILLQAFEDAQKDVDYYALDLSKPELERTLGAVEGLYQHVHCHGLFGTYDDGLVWLQKPSNLPRSKCILWMGSSIGNLNRTEAADFLRSFTSILHDSDTMLIGMDACQNPEKVFHGYNDRLGKTHEFVLNGLNHANRLLEKEAFKRGDWKVIGQYDAREGRHQAFYSPHRDVEVEGVVVKAGERIRIEESYKYSAAQVSRLWQEAGMMPRASFGDASGEYSRSRFVMNGSLDKARQFPRDLAMFQLPADLPFSGMFSIRVASRSYCKVSHSHDIICCFLQPDRYLKFSAVKNGFVTATKRAVELAGLRASTTDYKNAN